MLPLAVSNPELRVTAAAICSSRRFLAASIRNYWTYPCPIDLKAYITLGHALSHTQGRPPRVFSRRAFAG